MIDCPTGHCHVAAFSLNASASGLRQHLRGRFGGEEGLAGMGKLGATRAAASVSRAGLLGSATGTVAKNGAVQKSGSAKRVGALELFCQADQSYGKKVPVGTIPS